MFSRLSVKLLCAFELILAYTGIFRRSCLKVFLLFLVGFLQASVCGVYIYALLCGISPRFKSCAISLVTGFRLCVYLVEQALKINYRSGGTRAGRSEHIIRPSVLRRAVIPRAQRFDGD